MATSSSSPSRTFRATKASKTSPHDLVLAGGSSFLSVRKHDGSKSYDLDLSSLKAVTRERDRVVKLVLGDGDTTGLGAIASAKTGIASGFSSLGKGLSSLMNPVRNAVNKAASKSQGARMTVHAIGSTVKVGSEDDSLDWEFATTEERDLFYRAVRGVVCAQDPPGCVSDHTVLVCSWNMGNASPPVSLAPWIPRRGPGATAPAYDVIAVGVQECQYQPRPIIPTCEKDWLASLEVAVGADYTLFESLSLWELRLAVFVRADLVRSGVAHSPAKGSVTAGIAGGLGGNKGGVGVRLFLRDTQLAFVTAHLAAHQDKVAERHADAASVLMGLGALGSADRLDALHQFDHVFFFGDLNYRVDIPRDDALFAIKNAEWQRLLAADQLIQEMGKGRVLAGCLEPTAPAFRPTYKFDRGTVGNSERAYAEEKQRTPSYTDRILFKSLDPGRQAVALSYQSFESLDTSDHAPVSAGFALKAASFAVQPVQTPITIALSQIAVEGLQVDRISGIKAPPLGTVAIDLPGLCTSGASTGTLLPVIDRALDNNNNNRFSYTPEGQLSLCVTQPAGPVLRVAVFIAEGMVSGGIGFALIPLKEATKAGAPVRARLTLGGRVMGEVRGLLAISEDKNVDLINFEDQAKAKKPLPPIPPPKKANSSNPFL